MTRQEAIKILKAIRVYECYPKSASEETKEAIDMAIEALSADAVQGCDGCRYNTRIPQKQCLRCARYWRDGYERKGGESDG